MNETLFKKADEKLIKLVNLIQASIKGTHFEGKTYLVGGCVRDLILGIPAKDVDIVVELPNGGMPYTPGIMHSMSEHCNCGEARAPQRKTPHPARKIPRGPPRPDPSKEINISRASDLMITFNFITTTQVKFYLDLCFIRSLRGLLHLAPLFLPLPVGLHNST